LVFGYRVEIGSPVHLPGGQPDAGAAARVAQLEDGGQTAAVMRLDRTTAALLAIADRTRPAAGPAVARITEVTGAAPILLTRDNQRAATRLASQVGIGDVRAGLLPQDKAAAVNDLQARGARVLLVGDGINDAPALAAAHTGVAMGRAGSDLALDTADAVITLSRRVRRVVTANLIIAAVIITALATWDLAGHLPLPLGVLGHEGSTVIIGRNGLRLLRTAAWRKANTSGTDDRAHSGQQAGNWPGSGQLAQQWPAKPAPGTGHADRNPGRACTTVSCPTGIFCGYLSRRRGCRSYAAAAGPGGCQPAAGKGAGAA
jgi:cation transport ATPase